MEVDTMMFIIIHSFGLVGSQAYFEAWAEQRDRLTINMQAIINENKLNTLDHRGIHNRMFLKWNSTYLDMSGT